MMQSQMRDVATRAANVRAEHAKLLVRAASVTPSLQPCQAVPSVRPRLVRRLSTLASARAAPMAAPWLPTAAYSTLDGGPTAAGQLTRRSRRTAGLTCQAELRLRGTAAEAAAP